MTDVVDISRYLPELGSIWLESTGESKITVAILDGPVDLSHPCFEGAYLTLLQTLISKDANNAPSSQHGTNVASIIFGQHGSSVCGISPGCHGLIVPVFSSGSDGSLAPCSQIDLAHAITQSVEWGAHVINISGGEIESSGKPHPLLASAVRLCDKNGVLVVAAAGNDGCQCLHVPAAVPSTLAVGAMDAQKSPLKFSNWGDAYQSNGILAPGDKIIVAEPGGGVDTKSGTSFATPIVSGIAALLLSIQKKRGDKPDPNFVREAILQSAHSCSSSDGSDCRRYLAGSLNVAGALAYIRKDKDKVAYSNNFAKKNQKNASTDQKYLQNKSPDLGLQSAELSAINIEQTKEPLQTLSPNALRTLDNAPSIAKISETEITIQNKEEKKMVETVNEKSSCITKKEEEYKMDGPAENTCGCSEASQTQFAPSAVQVSESIEAPNNIENSQSVMPKNVQPLQMPNSAQLVYALGTIGFDFGTEARRDAFIQNMEATKENPYPNPDDPTQLLKHLEKHPEYAASMIWTLDIEGTTVYAIQPRGTFSPRVYERLREFLNDQTQFIDIKGTSETKKHPMVERVSIPGVLQGQARLYCGQVVPVIIPELRGMYSWKTKDLVSSLLGPVPKSEDKRELEIFMEVQSDLYNFLQRIYYELMNLGRASPERAINFAATNAFQVKSVLEDSARDGFALDSIASEKSPICRPDSDCWDVKLTFFKPKELTTVARRVYRFTIDVSDVVPVSIGEIRHWSIY